MDHNCGALRLNGVADELRPKIEVNPCSLSHCPIGSHAVAAGTAPDRAEVAATHKTMHGLRS